MLGNDPLLCVLSTVSATWILFKAPVMQPGAALFALCAIYLTYTLVVAAVLMHTGMR